MNTMLMTDAIMAMIREAGVPAEEIIAALSKAAAKDKAKTAPKPISTQLQAETARPGVHRVKDAVGLYLRKGEGDAGNWFHRYWFDGKRREIGLGALAATTLIEARKKHAKIVDLRNEGKDPLVVRRAAKNDAADEARAEALATNRWTFKAAVEDYLAAHASSWKAHDAKRVWHGPFVRYAYPIMGAMKLDDIRVDHVVAVMNACSEAGVKATGVKLRGHIEQVINAAIAKGRRNAALGNPATVKLVKATSPALKRLHGDREHHRRIALDDAPAAFQRIAELAAGKSTHAPWAFMILTAARPSEALYARWDEVDLEKRLWTVPAARMKAGQDHVVPLSEGALAVLTRQASIRCGDYVFPGRGAGKPSYVNFATAPKTAGFDAGAPHGWRSIFRDWAGDVGRVDRDLAEAALAHSLGAVEGAYRRQSAIEARRPVMGAYADWLMGRGAVNVIALAAHRV
jgi:integrase